MVTETETSGAAGCQKEVTALVGFWEHSTHLGNPDLWFSPWYVFTFFGPGYL